ncbi:hypothetical protein D3C74_436470 [compost metagenome]
MTGGYDFLSSVMFLGSSSFIVFIKSVESKLGEFLHMCRLLVLTSLQVHNPCNSAGIQPNYAVNKQYDKLFLHFCRLLLLFVISAE